MVRGQVQGHYIIIVDIDTILLDRYGARRFLGTRDILGEDDEIQPNGRIFAKLELGDYRSA